MDSGILRGYFLNKDGKEITDCICFRRGTAAMATCRMEPGTPSPMAIEMLEEGRFFCVPMQVIARMQMHDMEMAILYNQLLTDALERNWKMKQVLAQCTALQRYQWFLEEYPGIIDRVNNKYIASFLGMTPVSLSRLRKEIREKEL